MDRFSTHDKGLTVELIELKGNIFNRLNKDDKSFPVSGEVTSIFIKSRVPDPENPGKTKLVRKLVPPGELMIVRKGNLIFESNGDFTWTFPSETVPKPKNLDAFITQNPVFGTKAYVDVMFKDKQVPNALISSFIVTIPATIIPITIAAFAAYAFSWMKFPGRDWLFILIVCLMVVPTQLAFLPILKGFSGIASWATALNQWLTDCEITKSLSLIHI